MRGAHQCLWPVIAVSMCYGCARPAYSISPAGDAPAPRCAADGTTLRAARLLDGRGGAFAGVVIAVRDGTIASVGACLGPVTHDLGEATLLPGLIDVHVHLDWHFGPDDRFRPTPAALDAHGSAAIIDNAGRTLDAGFTTVQSLGSAADLALRAAVTRGDVPGPRILTSAGQIEPDAHTPQDLRAGARTLRARGADAVKIIAPGGLRGEALARFDAQLSALCDEARALGMRSVVHAQDPPAIRAAVRARCGQVEHGMFADDEALRAMADAGIYFDPNIGLNLQNYLEHRPAFLGATGYTAARFRAMETLLPTLAPLFARARTAGLRMPLGSDAVAGAHGRNAREIVARVRDGHQPPGDAIVSATSLAAESLGLSTRIGTLAPGFVADIIAVPGDPLRDVRVLERVTFVMQGGRVRKAPPAR